MAQRETVVVRGYREMMQATLKADRMTRKEIRDTFRHVGDLVKSDAQARFASIDQKSAAGYRTRVRQRGVIVEQSLRRTTGKHSPQYGILQMQRALLPALADNQDEVMREMEQAINTACDTWERSYPVVVR